VLIDHRIREEDGELLERSHLPVTRRRRAVGMPKSTTLTTATTRSSFEHQTAVAGRAVVPVRRSLTGRVRLWIPGTDLVCFQ
jgi:hypothetical protein